MAAAAAGRDTWDVPESQVAVDFPDDAAFPYHVRFLFVRLPEAGKWIGGSSDLDLEVVNLNEHHVIALQRNSPIPARLRGILYYHGDLDEAAFGAARAEANTLAQVLGATVAAPTAGIACWYFADPAWEQFGEPLPLEVVGNAARMRIQGSLAMADMLDEGWTFAERVLQSDLAAWIDEKRNGPGRDHRILPIVKDARGHRYRSLRDAVGVMKAPPVSAPVDWPFRGPGAFPELSASVRAAGEDYSTFHDYYIRSSGLDPHHPVALKHREFLSVLTHMVCFDQLDGNQLASAELLARLILQIHQAVKRSPKSPDFRGTQLMVMSKLDSTGGVLTGDFARYVADEQKSEAFTLKQQRLFSEEEEKRKKPPGKGNGGKDGS